jgi:hypothetical protein
MVVMTRCVLVEVLWMFHNLLVPGSSGPLAPWTVVVFSSPGSFCRVDWDAPGGKYMVGELWLCGSQVQRHTHQP